MTSLSAQRTTAHQPKAPGRTGRSPHAPAGRHRAAPDTELAADLRRRTGYDRCYDVFAPQLYRYCWSLLGPGGTAAEPDRATGALYETFLAAAHRIDALRDEAEFAAWLYALARTAARRRGFATRSPYAQLATAEAEQAVVQLSLRLPPSHRELLELYLRHGLSTPRIAAILGLGADTTAELCRTAVLHSAELLTRHDLVPEGASDRGPEHCIRMVLGALEPPGPPPALRDRVLGDCASAQAAAERSAAAEALAPLGADGFPLHRDRTPGAGPCEAAGQTAAAGAADSDAGDGGAGETAALPADRVTTRDVPARADPEPVAGPGPGAAAGAGGGDAAGDPGGGGRAGRRGRRSRWVRPGRWGRPNGRDRNGTGAGPERSAAGSGLGARWPTPITALLAAAAVVACLWGAVAGVRMLTGDTVTDTGALQPPTAAPSIEGAPGAVSERPGGAAGDGQQPGDAGTQVHPQPPADATVRPQEAPEAGGPAGQGAAGASTALPEAEAGSDPAGTGSLDTEDPQDGTRDNGDGNSGTEGGGTGDGDGDPDGSGSGSGSAGSGSDGGDGQGAGSDGGGSVSDLFDDLMGFFGTGTGD
ncbi:hypothetical protein GCM10027570_24550 [Streptomonospora sediminis]